MQAGMECLFRLSLMHFFSFPSFVNDAIPHHAQWYTLPGSHTTKALMWPDSLQEKEGKPC